MRLQQYCAAVLLGLASTLSADDLRVLPGDINGTAPRDMMTVWLRAKVDEAHERWTRNAEESMTNEGIWQQNFGASLMMKAALGPFPKRTDLNARTVDVIQRDGYRVEKVMFESRPQHYVTGLLYVPDDASPENRRPAVLVPCGHSNNGKAHVPYQKAAALLALNGLIALCFDPIDQGERVQLLDESGAPRIHGTRGHTMVGVGSILLGHNTASFEVWDGRCGLDYLQQRPEVQPRRLGCMGNSGGGTQTCYITVIDERVQAAAPSCYVTNFSSLVHTIGVQDAEQNLFAQIGVGLDHANFLVMRPAIPILVVAATNDFFDIGGTWASYRYAKRVYTMHGVPERIDIMEDKRGHNYDKPARQASVAWMLRWLAEDDRRVEEPDDIEVLTDAEAQVTPEGQVMLIAGARSVYDINEAIADQHTAKRSAANLGDKDLRTAIRKRTRIGLLDRPVLEVEEVGVVTREGYDVVRMTLAPEPGVLLPALHLRPHTPDDALAPVIYVNDQGKHVEIEQRLQRFVQQGRAVLAVDLRGTGETRQTSQGYFRPHFGSDGQDVYTAYVLGLSYVGMRAEDLLGCARWLGIHHGKPARLVSVGHVGVPALHAAALEPEFFESVRVEKCIDSWTQLVHDRWTENQLQNTVHGALLDYDLPDLRRLIGTRLDVSP